MAYTTIDDPSAHFQIALYTGQGGTATAVTNDGNSDLQPDLIFFKSRSTTARWNVMDSTRGTTKVLYLEGNDAEATDGGSEKPLDSFNSDGFQAGESLDHHTNINTDSMVAWQWKANGGTTSSNSTGDITTTVQTDSTSGFSIITYTGNNTDNQTIGHGLGAVPGFAVFKSRAGAVAGTGNWVTHHQSFSGTEYQFVTTAAKASTNNNFKSSPTNSIFTLGNSDVNESENIVCYAWAPIQGFSKFGSYTGNGNADGPFIYLGFKPAWVVIKRTDSTNHWGIFDSTRDTFNQVGQQLYMNDNGAEDADAAHSSGRDYLSNGFKLRETGNAINGSSATYIYMAFAEHPFVSSKGVPCTAR